MGRLLSDDDSNRLLAAVEDYENRIFGVEQPKPPTPRFFQTVPLRLFRLIAAVSPPQSLDKPKSVLAQPFDGEDSPELSYTDEVDEDGNPVPVEELIYHTIPGVTLCADTLVWAVYAYSEWRIIHYEQWPVQVQQLDAEGFPSGSATITLTIDDVPHSFQVAGDATAGTLLAAVRDHPEIDVAKSVQAIGGPLSYCAINLMFGPTLTGKKILPMHIDNGSMNPPLSGLRVRLLAPLWAIE